MTFARPEAEAELLAALEEIGDGDGFDFDALDISLDEPALDADGDAAELEPPADERRPRIRPRIPVARRPEGVRFGPHRR